MWSKGVVFFFYLTISLTRKVLPIVHDWVMIMICTYVHIYSHFNMILLKQIQASQIGSCIQDIHNPSILHIPIIVTIIGKVSNNDMMIEQSQVLIHIGLLKFIVLSQYEQGSTSTLVSLVNHSQGSSKVTRWSSSHNDLWERALTSLDQERASCSLV